MFWCINLWKHYQNWDNEHIHNFPKVSSLPLMCLPHSIWYPPPQLSSLVTTYLLSLKISLHFLEVYMHGIIYYVVFFFFGLAYFTGIIILKFIYFLSFSIAYSINVYIISSVFKWYYTTSCIKIWKQCNFPSLAFILLLWYSLLTHICKLHMKFYLFKQLYI